MPIRKKTTKTIFNRRANYDYEIGDSLIVGIELNGPEVKALRMGHGHLRGAYVIVRDGELWLLNATISTKGFVGSNENDQTRTRKLLAKKIEIDHFIQSSQKGLSIIPLEILTGGRFIKLKIATGKGRKKYDKRQKIKEREEKRRIDRFS